MIEFAKDIIALNPFGLFTVFILGILLIIFIQNCFYFYFYKDTIYLWYASYIFIIIVDQLTIFIGAYYQVKYDLDFRPFKLAHTSLEWIYNSLYVIFVVRFGGRELFSAIKAKNVIRVIKSSLLILACVLFLEIVMKQSISRYGFLFVQVPLLIGVSIYTFYYLFKMNSKIKYYLIGGSMAFSIFSILSLSSSIISKSSIYNSWIFFYAGIFIENIFFSIGLIIKQKIVLRERNLAQNELIIQLQKNEKYKSLFAEKLQREVEQKKSEIVLLNKKAENEHIKQIETAFQKEILELKISSLLSQMNPHFLFNSLNSIKLYIIKNDKENGIFFLSKFAKLMRKILAASREVEVTLRAELETIGLYTSIENIRFKGAIKFDIEISADIDTNSIKLPPMILQPYIENAIWHGLSAKEGPKILTVSISALNKEQIEIRIKDNGIGRQRSYAIQNNKLHKKASVGIKLTNERLSHFSLDYTKNHQVKFIDLMNGDTSLGTEVIITLPIMKSNFL